MSSVDTAPRDFALDATGDLQLLNGDLVMAVGPAGVTSDVASRLATQLGECFLDTTLGVDWRGRVLGKKLSPGDVKALVRAEILGTPGVASLDTLDATFTGASRALAVKFRAVASSGDALEASLQVNLGGT